MTLCIVALTEESEAKGGQISDIGNNRIVVCADNRVETDIAGSDTAFKYEVLADGIWATFADDVSKAHEFAVTCREVLRANPPQHHEELFQLLNAASAAHKGKLCEQAAQQRFGRSYENIWREGEHGLPENSRTRFFLHLEDLNFGCEMLVYGFVRNKAVLFKIDHDGEVRREDDFAAIGSGAVVAEGNLYFRRQNLINPLEITCYNLYESARLAFEAKAPGVGQTAFYMVHSPRSEAGTFPVRVITVEGLAFLIENWKKYGPKEIKNMKQPDENWLKEFTALPPYPQEPEEEIGGGLPPKN